jgi:phosphotriesterase-related protein
MREITEGIGKTKVKAGVIKVATGNGRISPYEEMVLRAAARAQKETGIPIITHTEAGTMGPEQADLLISEGVSPQRIMIGHMCGSADLKYHISVLEKGAYIAFDRIGLEVIHQDTVRRACIVGLISIGYADRIMLSHDSVIRMLGRSIEEARALILPNWVPTHIFKTIIPALRESGVSAEKIKLMMVENPRRLFAG